MTLKRVNIDALMASSSVRFGTSGARGLVSNMSDELCYAFTMAFLQKVVSNNQAITKVILGHDLRPSSPRIASACALAIRDAGGEVVYAGALPTPALAYYALQLHVPAIIVTGSHIPFNRNGIKFYGIQGEISKNDERAMTQAVVEVPNTLTCIPLSIPEEAVSVHYMQRYVAFFGSRSLSGLRIGVYEHSSVARDLLRCLLNALGAEVVALGRTDNFVPIDTEAVRPEDVIQARIWAQQHQFNAIF